jgi:hypothetical protein
MFDKLKFVGHCLKFVGHCFCLTIVSGVLSLLNREIFGFGVEQ